MKGVQIYFLIFIFILCNPNIAWSQLPVRLYVTVNPMPARVCVGEPLEYRVVLENSRETPDLAVNNFTHFSMIGNPVQEQGTYTIHNRTIPFVSWTYTLRPVKAGRFTFSQASVTIAGKTYESQPVSVAVEECVSQKQPAQNNIPGLNQPESWVSEDEPLEPRARAGLSFQLEVNKRTCYVGEPVTAHYYLLSRLQCESSLVEQPSFNGFSVTDLPLAHPMAPATRKLQGRDYHEYSVRKAQLYPLQPGNFEAEPAVLDNRVRFIRATYATMNPVNAWMDLNELPVNAYRETSISLKTEAALIQVKPLPEAGRPVFFGGAVGVFTMHAALAADSFALNTPGQLTIRLSGKGNLHLLTAPVIRWPQGLEAYEPKTESALDKTTVPVSGELTFLYPFTAKDTGLHRIPPMSFAYFDPALEQYISRHTEPILFYVKPAIAADPAANASLQTGPGPVSAFFRHRWWVVLVIAGLMLFGLVIWLWRESRADKKAKEAMPALSETTDTGNNPSVPHWLDYRQQALAAYRIGDLSLYYRQSIKALHAYSETVPGSAESAQAMIRKIETALYNPWSDSVDDEALHLIVEDFWKANL